MTQKCDCGREAVTEIQIGWNPAANCGAGGGCYEPVCAACYAETDEAKRHARQHAEMLADLRAGRYTRTVLHGHVRWVGPGGRFLDDDTYRRLTT